MKHVAYVAIEIDSKSSKDCALKAILILDGLRKESDVIGETHLFATDDKPVASKASVITLVLYEIFKLDSSSMFKNIISNVFRIIGLK